MESLQERESDISMHTAEQLGSLATKTSEQSWPLWDPADGDYFMEECSDVAFGD